MYNLTATDIVNSFSGTDITDFSVGATSGTDIINSEIAFQAALLNEQLPDYFFSYLNHVDLEIVKPDTSNIFSPGLYAIASTVTAWLVPRGYTPCSINEFYGIDSNAAFVNLYTYNGPYKATVTNISGNDYLLSGTYDRLRQELLLSYDVDSSKVTVGMVNTVLRFMVCASLGNKLFPVGDSKWSIVSYYEEQADKYLELIRNGSISTVLGLNLLFKKNGYSSIRIGRG